MSHPTGLVVPRAVILRTLFLDIDSGRTLPHATRQVTVGRMDQVEEQARRFDVLGTKDPGLSMQRLIR